MTNALIITDTTAVRMNVIAQRTQNLLVAGAKAQAQIWSKSAATGRKKKQRIQIIIEAI